MVILGHACCADEVHFPLTVFDPREKPSTSSAASLTISFSDLVSESSHPRFFDENVTENI